MSDFEKLLLLGVAGVGLYTASQAFSNQWNRIEKQGASVIGLLVLAGLGATLFYKFEDATDRAKDLLN